MKRRSLAMLMGLVFALSGLSVAWAEEPVLAEAAEVLEVSAAEAVPVNETNEIVPASSELREDTSAEKTQAAAAENEIPEESLKEEMEQKQDKNTSEETAEAEDSAGETGHQIEEDKKIDDVVATDPVDHEQKIEDIKESEDVSNGEEQALEKDAATDDALEIKEQIAVENESGAPEDAETNEEEIVVEQAEEIEVLDSDIDSLLMAASEEDTARERDAQVPLYVVGAKANYSTVTVGKKITWTAYASGGTGYYAYTFHLFCGDTVVQYGNWQAGNTFSYTPTTPGNYYVACYAVDSDWNSILLAPEGGMVAVTTAAEPLSCHVWSKEGNNSDSYFGIGTEIEWYIQPSGGNHDYAYFFNIFCGNEVVYYGNWQLGNRISYKADKPGNYYVAAYVVDSSWTQIAQAPEGSLVQVEIFEPWGHIDDIRMKKAGDGYSSVYLSQGSSFQINYPITLSAYAENGNGQYIYDFQVFWNGLLANDSGWILDDEWTFTPTAAGEYTFKLYVTDTRWESIDETTRNGYYGIASDLAVGIYASYENRPKKAGDSFTVEFYAGGGTEVYAYCIEFYADYDLTEYLGGTGWSAMDKITVTAPAEGYIRILGYAMDSSGAIARDTYSIEVGDEVGDQFNVSIEGDANFIDEDYGSYVNWAKWWNWTNDDKEEVTIYAEPYVYRSDVIEKLRDGFMTAIGWKLYDPENRVVDFATNVQTILNKIHRTSTYSDGETYENDEMRTSVQITKVKEPDAVNKVYHLRWVDAIQ